MKNWTSKYDPYFIIVFLENGKTLHEEYYTRKTAVKYAKILGKKHNGIATVFTPTGRTSFQYDPND